MKESLLGLTTMTILFGLVWLSQGEIYTSKNNLKENVVTEENKLLNDLPSIANTIEDNTNFENINTEEDPVDTCEICKNINEVSPNVQYELQYTNMYDNFTFSDAFKLCRQCEGNDGIFYWKDNLYLTEIKQKETDIVEKELTESKTPPNTTHETVSSK